MTQAEFDWKVSLSAEEVSKWCPNTMELLDAEYAHQTFFLQVE